MTSFRIPGLRVMLFGLAVAGSSIGAYLLAQSLGQSLRKEPGAAPAPTEFVSSGLVVSASDLDLGEVWEATEFVHVLTIRNPSRAEKKVEDFSTSCFCTAVEPRTIVVPAGGETMVRVHIDPNHRSPDDANLAVRPFAVEIRPILDVTQARQPGWAIHGQFRSRVTFGVLSVHFGQEVVRDGRSPIRKLDATVHVPMQRLQARIEPTATGTVKLVPVPDNPNRLELCITPSNRLPIGPFQATVMVDVVDPSGSVAPGAVLPIAGDVQTEVRLLPARVILGIRPVGTTAETVVVFQAPVEAAWTVDHIETDSPNVTVEATAGEGIPAGRAFRVSQRAVREGNQTDTVRFVVRKAGGAPMTLTMEVMCNGEIPQTGVFPGKGGKQP
jgi:hypothetical protein